MAKHWGYTGVCSARVSLWDLYGIYMVFICMGGTLAREACKAGGERVLFARVASRSLEGEQAAGRLEEAQRKRDAPKCDCLRTLLGPGTGEFRPKPVLVAAGVCGIDPEFVSVSLRQINAVTTHVLSN